MPQSELITVLILSEGRTVSVQLPPSVYQRDSVAQWHEQLRQLPDFAGRPGSLLDPKIHQPLSDADLRPLRDSGVTLHFGETGGKGKVNSLQVEGQKHLRMEICRRRALSWALICRSEGCGVPAWGWSSHKA